MDPHQYAYREKRFTSDALLSLIHTALTRLESRGSYARLLFPDFSCAFNTTIPQALVNELLPLLLLALKPSLCDHPLRNWALDVLTERPQIAWVMCRPLPSPSTPASPRDVSSAPLLQSLLTCDCSAKHPRTHIVKFTDNTAVAGLTSHGDKHN